VGHGHTGGSHRGDVVVVDPDGMGEQHPAAQHIVVGQDLNDAAAVLGLQGFALGPGLGHVHV